MNDVLDRNLDEACTVKCLTVPQARKPLSCQIGLQYIIYLEAYGATHRLPTHLKTISFPRMGPHDREPALLLARPSTHTPALVPISTASLVYLDAKYWARDTTGSGQG